MWGVALKQIDRTLAQPSSGSYDNEPSLRWITEVKHYRSLLFGVVDQTQQRVDENTSASMIVDELSLSISTKEFLDYLTSLPIGPFSGAAVRVLAAGSCTCWHSVGAFINQSFRAGMAFKPAELILFLGGKSRFV